MKIHDILNAFSSSSLTDNNPQIKTGEVATTVHNLLIIDESGSMISIYEAALSGINETLNTIRNEKLLHAADTQYVTLVTFDSTHYNQIYNHVLIENAPEISHNQYRPNACTPLYDAIGRGINDLSKYVKPGEAVLVTIITDGYENASREFDGQAIADLIAKKRALGWNFTYIGANQDVEEVAKSLNIQHGLSFTADDTHTREMWEVENQCRSNYFSKLRSGKSCFEINDEDYF